MSHVFTLANAKGGCGKSTVALNLAICCARAGYRTLAVDLDQQGNLSAALGTDLNNLSLTTHRMLIDEEAEIEKFMVEVRPRLKLLPNTIDINCQIVMNEYIPHTGHFPPWDLGMFVLKYYGHLLYRFSNDLKPSRNRILDDDLLEKIFLR